MSDVPRVSVLITAHNVERYIGRCLRSVLDQSMRRHDYEIIVVNDASSDRTKFALEIFENDIILLNSTKKLGLPKSLNIGIQKARGRWIIRVDGDDYVNHELLNTLSLYLDMVPAIDAIACDYIMVDDTETPLGTFNCQKQPIACGIMFRTEQLIEIGLYDEKFKLREDEDLRIRFLKKYSIERIRLPLYRYRRHENNITNNKHQMEQYRRLLEAKHKDR